MFPFQMFHQLPVGESVYAFRTIRAIFAEGLNLFLRPAPVRQAGGFAIHSNGKSK